MDALCDEGGASHFLWQTLVLCANINFCNDCFIIHCNAHLVYFTKTDWQRKVKHSAEVVIEVRQKHQSECSKNKIVQLLHSLEESGLHE